MRIRIRPRPRPRSPEIRLFSLTSSRDHGPFSRSASFEYTPTRGDLGPTEDEETPRPCTSDARVFLRNLPILLVAEVPSEDRTCQICQETYLHGDQFEQPVKLPCGHIFGKECINRWLSPDEIEPKSSCPMCRVSFFEVCTSESDLSENESWNNIRPSNGAVEDRTTNSGIARASESAIEDDADEWTYRGSPRSATEARSQMQVFEQHWSDRMALLTHFRSFVPRPNPNARSAREVLQTFQNGPPLGYHEVDTLAEEMGQLFMRLRTTMRLLKILPPWNEYGPTANNVIEPESRAVVEIALHRMVHIEEAWLWAQRGA